MAEEYIYPMRDAEQDDLGFARGLRLIFFGAVCLGSIVWGSWLAITGHAALIIGGMFGVAASALSYFMFDIFIRGNFNNFRNRYPTLSKGLALLAILGAVVAISLVGYGFGTSMSAGFLGNMIIPLVAFLLVSMLTSYFTIEIVNTAYSCQVVANDLNDLSKDDRKFINEKKDEKVKLNQRLTVEEANDFLDKKRAEQDKIPTGGSAAHPIDSSAGLDEAKGKFGVQAGGGGGPTASQVRRRENARREDSEDSEERQRLTGGISDA